ncbi:hypothetical protein IE81DRAFT_341209 [Ceraceosorus guamensis]|uniref:Uncharacterized protein n=1 Tax=Ceraceosorus guamensis TaxID=1522189 RepID=A0A316VZE7_9BASI|nr:hypothetical protein IE81DRAFT_341209 [Ceraceosorus guamensis]PWN42819.1 hypothetical protein IE81DRAFT_341209 [Ceraceosorus guamensis]
MASTRCNTVLSEQAAQLVINAPALDQILPNRIFAQSAETSLSPSRSKPALLEALDVEANKTKTANNAGAFESTGDALLDLFSSLTDQNLRGQALESKLQGAWRKDAASTLRLILYARSIAAGAGDRTLFLRAAAWMYAEHPKTLLGSLLPLLVAHAGLPTCKDFDAGNGVTARVERPARLHGSWKDPLNVLLIATKSLTTHLSMDQLASATKELPERILKRKCTLDGTPHRLAGKGRRASNSKQSNDEHQMLAHGGELVQPGPTRAEKAKRMDEQRRQAAAEARRSAAKQASNKVSQLVESNVQYRAVYATVVKMFVRQLREDEGRLERIEEGGDASELVDHLSYAGKWAPSEGASVDNQTGLAQILAKALYPDQRDARAKYRALLCKLRRAKKVPEQGMVQGSWEGKISLPHIPARAFNISQALLWKHALSDMIRYAQRVAEGKSTVAGASETPGELVLALHQARALDARIRQHLDQLPTQERTQVRDQILASQTQLLDGQWENMKRTLVAEMEATRQAKVAAGTIDGDADKTMRPMIPVCDLSGSMEGPQLNTRGLTPIHISTGLSLLLSELAPEPWSGRVISFSEEPKVVRLPEAKSFSRTVEHFQKHLPMGYSTNFEAVFDLLLNLAQQSKMAKQETGELICVAFTDMHFDAACDSSFGMSGTATTSPATIFSVIKRKWDQAGYDLPHLIFWNLSAGKAAMPVESDTPHRADEGPFGRLTFR